MDNVYDMFRKLPDGSKTWFAAVGGLREAEARVRELKRSEPCEYYVCDLSERRVVAVLKSNSPQFTWELPSSAESFFLRTAGAA